MTASLYFDATYMTATCQQKKFIYRFLHPVLRALATLRRHFLDLGPMGLPPNPVDYGSVDNCAGA
jgi:hypothetical protein